MMKFKILVLLGLFSMYNCFAQAQDGLSSVKGIIVDKVTKETIIGASVFIEGTSKGSATDIDGKFEIASVSPGVQKLKISFIGYSSTILEIKLVPGETYNVGTINLSEDNQTLDEFKVVSERIVKSEISMITEIKNATEALSGISQAQIRRIPESDASGVMKRISGVSIYGDNYMVVRGLSERYNKVYINGTTAPSFEIDKNSFSFDIVPNSVVENIVVYKTASPELPGDFSGGLAKITTNSVPERDYIRVKYSTSFRRNTTFKNFKDQYHGKYSGLGLDDGSYKIPFGENEAPPGDKKSNSGDYSPEMALKYNKRFNNKAWVPIESKAPMNKSYSIEWGKRIQLTDNITLGNFSYLGIKDSRTRRRDYKTAFYLPGLRGGNSDDFFKSGFDDDHADFRREQIGGLSNFSLRVGSKHSFDFKNFYNSLAKSAVLQRTFFLYNALEDDLFDDDVPIERGFLLTKNFKEIYSAQIGGDHHLLDGFNVDWVAGYTWIENDMPDFRAFGQDISPNIYNIDTVIKGGEEKIIYSRLFEYTNQLTTLNQIGLPRDLGRNYSNVEEKTYSAGLNFKYQLDLSNIWEPLKPEIKIGGYYEKKTRDFLTRSFMLQTFGNPTIPMKDLRKMPLDLLYSDEIFNTSGVFAYREKDDFKQKYNASNENIANYLALKVPLGEKLLFNGGVRREDNLLFYDGNINSDVGNESLQSEYRVVSYLPSVNFIATLSDQITLRLGYFKNVNRPIFREIAPVDFYDFFDQQIKNGNLILKNATAHNFDFRFETYPNLGESFSLAGFYKTINTPIANGLIKREGGDEEYVEQVLNAESAKVYGIEADFRKGLGKIFGSENLFLENTYLVFNTTLSKGNVIFPETLVYFNGNKVISLRNNDVKKRKLIGHSQILFNAGMYFNEPQKLRASFAVFYNVIGPRLIRYGFGEGRGSIPDMYETHRHLLDLTISKNLGKHLQLSFKVNDILGEPFKKLMYLGDSESLPRSGKDIVSFESYRTGTKFTFQMSINL